MKIKKIFISSEGSAWKDCWKIAEKTDEKMAEKISEKMAEKTAEKIKNFPENIPLKIFWKNHLNLKKNLFLIQFNEFVDLNILLINREIRNNINL